MIPELKLAETLTESNIEALYTDGWAHVCWLSDLPLMEGKRTTIDSHKVAVFRLPDGLAAIDAECPHRGGPLQDGLVADSCVTCPLHDRRVDLKTGAMEGHDESVNVHDVFAAGDGSVWVRLASRRPAGVAALAEIVDAD